MEGTDSSGPRTAERKINEYRSDLLRDMNIYEAMKNGQLDQDLEFMGKVEQRVKEAIGYGYFDEGFTL